MVAVCVAVSRSLFRRSFGENGENVDFQSQKKGRTNFKRAHFLKPWILVKKNTLLHGTMAWSLVRFL